MIVLYLCYFGQVFKNTLILVFITLGNEAEIQCPCNIADGVNWDSYICKRFIQLLVHSLTQ